MARLKPKKGHPLSTGEEMPGTSGTPEEVRTDASNADMDRVRDRLEQERELGMRRGRGG